MRISVAAAPPDIEVVPELLAPALAVEARLCEVARCVVPHLCAVRRGAGVRGVGAEGVEEGRLGGERRARMRPPGATAAAQWRTAAGIVSGDMADRTKMRVRASTVPAGICGCGSGGAQTGLSKRTGNQTQGGRGRNAMRGAAWARRGDQGLPRDVAHERVHPAGR